MASLNINGRMLEVVERGEGQPVVLVHGSASDHRTWSAQLERFGQQYRTIAYSRRYHWPNEPIADGADYSLLEHVDDLQALLHTVASTPVHLVGHSYGAFVCLLLAIRDPALVRTLVLAEPPAFTLFVSDPPKPWEILLLFCRRPSTASALVQFGTQGVRPATAAARRGDMDAAMRIFGRATLGPAFYERLSPARLEQVRANAIAAEFLGSGYPTLKDADVSTVQAPTLLLSGQSSPKLFHRILARLVELLPRRERIEIREASHIMHEDNAITYNGVVTSFLAQHRGE